MERNGDTNVVVGAVLLGVIAWCQRCHLVAVNLVAPSEPLHFLINLPGTHLIPPLMKQSSPACFLSVTETPKEGCQLLTRFAHHIE